MSGLSEQQQQALQRLLDGQLPDFAERRSIRLAAGISIRDLATVLGVSHAAISNWETGKMNPSKEFRVAYRDALDVMKGSGSVDAMDATEVAVTPGTLLEESGLPTRVVNTLIRDGIRTIGQLIKHSECDLHDLRNLGTHSIETIKTLLARNGLSFAPKPAQHRCPYGCHPKIAVREPLSAEDWRPAWDR